MPAWSRLTLLLLLAAPASAAEPLHARVDALVDAGARGRPVSPPADDGEFLRRVTLDLAGRIPTAAEARAFLADRSADRRARRVDLLLAGADYPVRMQNLFHVVLMERLGDHPAWDRYLLDAFRANRPYDEMAREILRGRVDDPRRQGAAFWLARRLQNYGQNPVDHPALARDVGRLFLGKDLRCAQCHDHLFIKDYKQADFQGLFAFVQNAYLVNPATPAVAEKPVAGKVAFASVFGKGRGETAPRVPGRKELALPVFKKGDEFLPADRKGGPRVLRFSPLAELAREVPQSPDFSRNAVNRLWWAFLGRGLVHPLDQHHAGNPPSHPELLDLLAREFVAHKYDVRWLVRELVLTRAYGRSGRLPAGVTAAEPARFTTALERRLSAEQLLAATLGATEMRPRVTGPALVRARQAFARAFAGPASEPEEDVAPSLRGALFLLNDPLVLAWFAPQPGNLVNRLGKMTEPRRVAEELYLAVLTRRPDAEEVAEVAAALAGKSGAARLRALSRLAWALVASTEFGTNH